MRLVPRNTLRRNAGGFLHVRTPTPPRLEYVVDERGTERAEEHEDGELAQVRRFRKDPQTRAGRGGGELG
jgi:hypothetical protein